MNPSVLQGLFQQLHCRIPLFGWWIRRRAARKLVRAGSPEAIAMLAFAFTECRDRGVRRLAWKAMESVTDQAGINELCAQWLKTRNPELGQLIRKSGWVSNHSANARVATALKSGVMENLDEETDTSLILQATNCEDEDMVRSAIDLLTQTENPQAIDWMADRWVQTGDSRLATIFETRKLVGGSTLKALVWTAIHAGQPERLAHCEPEVLPLLEELRDLGGAALEESVRAAYLALKHPQVCNELCRRAIEGGDAFAQSVVAESGMVPEDEMERAVFFILSGRWDEYDVLDFEQRLIRLAYLAAPESKRNRLVARAQAAGRTDVLKRMLGVGLENQQIENLSGDELNLIVATLIDREDWTSLWELAFQTTLAWTIYILKQMAGSDWMPTRHDEQSAYLQLRELARAGLPYDPAEIADTIPVSLCQATANVTANVNAVAFHPDRPLIAIGTGDRRAAVWNFQTGELEHRWGPFDHSIGRVTYTPDGALIVGERTNGMADCRIYRCHEHADPQPIGKHRASVTGLEGLDGDRVVSSGRDQVVTVWDVNTGRAVHQRQFDFWPRNLTLSPCRQRILLSHRGTEMVAAEDLRTSRRYDWSEGIARSVCFTPDSDDYLVGKVNGDLLRGEVLRATRLNGCRHAGEITGIAILPEKQILISGDSTGIIVFRSWPQCARLGIRQTAGQRLTSLSVNADEAFMVTGDSDTSIAFWDLRGADVVTLMSKPLERATPRDLAAASSFKGATGLPAEARNTLRFVELLLRHRFRYDIEIVEPVIKTGEHEIILTDSKPC